MTRMIRTKKERERQIAERESGKDRFYDLWKVLSKKEEKEGVK